MSNEYGTRDDCTRDNVATMLPNACTLGFGLYKAKRGNLVQYEIDNVHFAGRVVGRVHCEGKTYIEVIQFDRLMTMAHVRWIESHAVKRCIPRPHYEVIAFLTGDWSDADAILKTAARGHVCKAWMDDLTQRIEGQQRRDERTRERRLAKA